MLIKLIYTKNFPVDMMMYRNRNNQSFGEFPDARFHVHPGRD
jgi:hypothetical protein